MNHLICVPVKPFLFGKSRLSEYLDLDTRIELNRQLFRKTLETIGRLTWNPVLIISKDEEARRIAQRLGFSTIAESSPYGLNRAINQVFPKSPFANAETITIIPSDLPLIHPLALEGMMQMRISEKGLILIPDRHKKGTNFLSFPLSVGFQSRFGKKSFVKHIQSAVDLGMDIKILTRHTFCWDIDTYEDAVNLLEQFPRLAEEFPIIKQISECILIKEGCK